MCTDNPILLRHTLNSPTIVCMQRKAEKKVPTESDIVAANKLAFNDDIGVVTNHVTGMIERRAGFDAGSPEYDTLSYRIMCGQNYQQATIDRAKGVIAKSMPPYWYSYRDCISNENIPGGKDFNLRIVASEKPYFMKYVYPSLKTKFNEYIRSNKSKAIRLFLNAGIHNLDELMAYEPKSKEMQEFIDNYIKHMVVGQNPCVVNRMCWLAEKEFKSFSGLINKTPEFDYSILKCGIDYSSKIYNEVFHVYEIFRKKYSEKVSEAMSEKNNDINNEYRIRLFMLWFKKTCSEFCTNEKELCDILIDICYQNEGTKALAWELCGDIIIDNLLQRNGNVFNFPVANDENPEFKFSGRGMCMRRKIHDKPDSE